MVGKSFCHYKAVATEPADDKTKWLPLLNSHGYKKLPNTAGGCIRGRYVYEDDIMDVHQPVVGWCREHGRLVRDCSVASTSSCACPTPVHRLKYRCSYKFIAPHDVYNITIDRPANVNQTSNLLIKVKDAGINSCHAYTEVKFKHHRYFFVLSAATLDEHSKICSIQRYLG